MNNAFQSISKSIVKEFLHTAVIIDDRAFTAQKETLPEKTVTPTRLNRTNKSVKVIKKLPNPYSFHSLDAQKLISSFASKGLICSVLCPSVVEAIEEESNNTILAATNSDIVIIDWQIHHHHDGEIALKIIKEILENDSVPDRLRFICIYTGSNDMATKISDTVKSEIFEQQHLEFTLDKNNLIFKTNSVVISLIAKKETPLPVNYRHLVVSEEQLPEKIIEIFTKQYSGLVSNMTMKALSAIRDNSQKLLAKFSKELDSAFLTHRATISKQIDAENHLIQFICSEITSILSNDSLIEPWIDKKTIEMWYNNKIAEDKEFDYENVQIKRDIILNCLHSGIANTTIENLGNKKKDKLYQKLTQLLSNIYNDNLDLEFARLSLYKTRYKRKRPFLNTGTIIQNLKTKKYWVCIQPKCDCVRLEDSKHFPLLPLLKELKTTSRISLPTFEIGNTNRFWFIPTIPSYCEMYEFKSALQNKDLIYSKRQKDNWIFLTKNRVQFKFIVELKDEFAQDILNKYASIHSRVGTNPSEWLRKITL